MMMIYVSDFGRLLGFCIPSLPDHRLCCHNLRHRHCLHHHCCRRRHGRRIFLAAASFVSGHPAFVINEMKKELLIVVMGKRKISFLQRYVPVRTFVWCHNYQRPMYSSQKIPHLLSSIKKNVIVTKTEKCFRSRNLEFILYLVVVSHTNRIIFDPLVVTYSTYKYVNQESPKIFFRLCRFPISEPPWNLARNEIVSLCRICSCRKQLLFEDSSMMSSKVSPRECYGSLHVIIAENEAHQQLGPET